MNTKRSRSPSSFVPVILHRAVATIIPSKRVGNYRTTRGSLLFSRSERAIFMRKRKSLSPSRNRRIRSILFSRFPSSSPTFHWMAARIGLPAAHVKFDRFSLVWSGATPRVVERVPVQRKRSSHDDRYYAIPLSFITSRGGIYYSTLRSRDTTLLLPLLLCAAFTDRVFSRVSFKPALYGRPRDAFHSPSTAANRLRSFIPLRFDTTTDFFPIELLTADRRIPFETCSMEV